MTRPNTVPTYSSEWREARFNQGLCRCGGPLKPGYKACEPCVLASRAKYQARPRCPQCGSRNHKTANCSKGVAQEEVVTPWKRLKPELFALTCPSGVIVVPVYSVEIG